MRPVFILLFYFILLWFHCLIWHVCNITVLYINELCLKQKLFVSIWKNSLLALKYYIMLGRDFIAIKFSDLGRSVQPAVNCHDFALNVKLSKKISLIPLQPSSPAQTVCNLFFPLPFFIFRRQPTTTIVIMTIKWWLSNFLSVRMSEQELIS